MHVVGRKLIKDFGETHADARQQMAAWLSEVEEAKWGTPADIKARYPSASFFTGNRVVFNIRGGRYRIVVGVSYKLFVVEILAVGTHAEYDGWEL